MRTQVLAVTSLLALTAACATQTHTYKNATELRSAAVNAGLHCTGYDPASAPKGATSAGVCLGGSPAQFVVYDATDDGKKAATSGITTARGSLKDKQALLTGPNWYVLGDSSDLSSIKDEIGGDLQGPISS